ncbi:MAG: DUF4360 domain-containing protein [Bdellovibrionota bacterium]
MKLQLIILTLALLGAFSANAATFGALTIAGAGCTNKTSDLKILSQEESLYAFPLNLYVKKAEGLSLDRKACTASLLVTLASDEKLMIENVSQKVNTRVHAGGTAKAQVEVFLTGQKGEVLKAESVAVDQYVNSRHHLSQDGVVTESACGGEVIVRANASAVAMASAKVSVYHEDLKLNLKVVKCAQ